MTETRTSPREPGAALLSAGRFFRPGTPPPDLHSVRPTGGREADAFYRDRWKVYVEDGVITWESQETDHPSAGPDRPEYEPRGCPRGAAFRWYTYSPTRVRSPHVRGVLLEIYREAKRAMYRLPAIAKYEDRYVTPTAAVGDARRLEESALPEGCGLDHEGGSGMGGDGPFGQDSGRRQLPLVSVETFHALRRRQTIDESRES